MELSFSESVETHLIINLPPFNIYFDIIFICASSLLRCYRFSFVCMSSFSKCYLFIASKVFGTESPKFTGFFMCSITARILHLLWIKYCCWTKMLYNSCQTVNAIDKIVQLQYWRVFFNSKICCETIKSVKIFHVMTFSFISILQSIHVSKWN